MYLCLFLKLHVEISKKHRFLRSLAEVKCYLNVWKFRKLYSLATLIVENRARWAIGDMPTFASTLFILPVMVRLPTMRCFMLINAHTPTLTGLISLTWRTIAFFLTAFTRTSLVHFESNIFISFQFEHLGSWMRISSFYNLHI